MLSNRCYEENQTRPVQNRPEGVNGVSNNGDAFKAFTFAAQGNSPQVNIPVQIPVSLGGFAVNASLINIPILSAQFNVANGGDSQAISVNNANQVESNHA
ncbi:hypothetical protein ACTHO0_03625 [Cytobacillus praedii]|uniref:Uncharacterized protein n=1 Tax=Cytobacillus praedii TaxID=1742358 RepID=A0A4R1AU65_9BACI|nr:hypothetical protein [Cytobacillus praedii]MED3552105.1 hypothetical protein [Cytobacillus praedii]MED3573330.1 hypothetical protein [Cytobacillus praedii]TCJ01198.1 hypothetical protein E0Y62_25270 [Cytobacillus praedii]